MDLLLLALAYPVVIAVLFYFAFYRPVQQERRRQREAMASLTPGDLVLTQGGLVATVKEVILPPEGPTQVVLELAPGVEVRAVATAIVQRLRPAQEQSPDQAPTRTREA
ncbi:MAG TPA: preprotein translocase subunit YajC [Dehalococcoidia bacterium]|nr:preprotein translocase subunit YajC [Dehalococcoidia bacterium]